MPAVWGEVATATGEGLQKTLAEDGNVVQFDTNLLDPQVCVPRSSAAAHLRSGHFIESKFYLESKQQK